MNCLNNIAIKIIITDVVVIYTFGFTFNIVRISLSVCALDLLEFIVLRGFELTSGSPLSLLFSLINDANATCPVLLSIRAFLLETII